MGVVEQVLRIDDPGGELRWYSSSTEGRRGFCQTCGSTMFFASSRWPGEVHATRANIEGELTQRPQAHAFFETHVDWAGLDPNDGLPRKTSAQIG